jgi:hypothetical protein
MYAVQGADKQLSLSVLKARRQQFDITISIEFSSSQQRQIDNCESSELEIPAIPQSCRVMPSRPLPAAADD